MEVSVVFSKASFRERHFKYFLLEFFCVLEASLYLPPQNVSWYLDYLNSLMSEHQEKDDFYTKFSRLSCNENCGYNYSRELQCPPPNPHVLTWIQYFYYLI